MSTHKPQLWYEPGRRIEGRDESFGTGRWAAVIVASTSAAEGRAADTCGPRIADWLTGHGYEVLGPIIVPDGHPVGRELRRLLTEIPEAERPRLVITTGGTGTAPSDETPEMTSGLIEKPMPGIMHALWTYGLQKLDEAVMSRGVAGARGCTFICNLPGSPGGVRDGITVLDPLLHHIQSQLEDLCNDHDHSHRQLPAQAAAGGPAAAASVTSGASAAEASVASGASAAEVPVASGGSAAAASTAGDDTARGVIHAAVTTAELSGDFGPEAAAAAVTTAQMGAIASFRGIIRNHDSGRDDVASLDYTAHPQAGEILAATAAAVAGEFAESRGGVRVWAAHRIGHLAVGDDALVVAVAAAHRREAFACCAELVDRIKAEVPIWKQQHYASGEHDWVGLSTT